MPPITREFLESETSKTLEAISDPKFIATLQEFRSLQGIDRLNFAESKMTPHAVSNAGVNLPSDMRISSRSFEEVGGKSVDYVDFAEGKRILEVLKSNHADKLAELKLNSPKIYEELIKFGDLGPADIERFDPDDDLNPWDPTNPRIPWAPGVPANPRHPFDPDNPYGVWACACAGVGTVCGGAGAGS